MESNFYLFDFSDYGIVDKGLKRKENEMNLTKQEAIENHRKMWNWIADETLRCRTKIKKIDYFEKHNIPSDERPIYLCYCCEYTGYDYNTSYCDDECPVAWEKKSTIETPPCSNSAFGDWVDVSDGDYQQAACLARKIAELPEKENSENANTAN